MPMSSHPSIEHGFESESLVSLIVSVFFCLATFSFLSHASFPLRLASFFSGAEISIVNYNISLTF